MKVLKVEMPDRSIWQIPLEVIVRHMLSTFGNPSNILVAQLMQTYADHPDMAIRYAKNTMKWTDLATHATCVKQPTLLTHIDAWRENKITTWITEVPA